MSVYERIEAAMEKARQGKRAVVHEEQVKFVAINSEELRANIKKNLIDKLKADDDYESVIDIWSKAYFTCGICRRGLMHWIEENPPDDDGDVLEWFEGVWKFLEDRKWI